MKKSDIALVVLVVGIVGFVAYYIVNMVLPPVDKSLQSVTKADAFTTSVTDPDKSVFNENGINPTVESTIGNDGFSTQVFKSGDE